MSSIKRLAVTLYCTKYCSRLYFLKLPSVYSWIFQSKKSVRRYAGMLFTIHWFFNSCKSQTNLNWLTSHDFTRIEIKISGKIYGFTWNLYLFYKFMMQVQHPIERYLRSTMCKKLENCSDVQAKWCQLTSNM